MHTKKIIATSLLKHSNLSVEEIADTLEVCPGEIREWCSLPTPPHTWTELTPNALKQWLADNKLSEKDLCSILENTADSVMPWLRGDRVPRRHTQQYLRNLIDNGLSASLRAKIQQSKQSKPKKKQQHRETNAEGWEQRLAEIRAKKQAKEQNENRIAEQAKELLAGGFSRKEVAERFGICPAELGRYLGSRPEKPGVLPYRSRLTLRADHLPDFYDQMGTGSSSEICGGGWRLGGGAAGRVRAD